MLFLAASSRGAEPPAALAAPATNLLAAVSAGYAAVTNLSCTVRRQVPDGDGELVSRVVFARGGRLAVETLEPETRRVVVDGESAWTKGAADKKPRRVAFAEQSPAQKASVLCVPASPEEALAALDGATGADLPSPAPPHARQTVFRLKAAPPDAPGRALVSLDGQGRIRAVDLFADADLRWRVASYAWDAPVEVLPGVWLFGRSTAETAVDGKPVALSTRFDNLRANRPLDPGLFDAAKAFSGK
ncbi:MAG: hypothetical protein IJV65_04445 [Kiritimatiellae bacterium]|nr:hypothetical protein [Kiritimatiellia bacterium]